MTETFWITVGGLGNQTFIIMAAIAHFLKHKNVFKLLPIDIPGKKNRPWYWNTWFSNVNKFVYHEARNGFDMMHKMHGNLPKYKEENLKYVPIPDFNKHNCNKMYVAGYWQSYKHTEGYMDDIKKMLGIGNKQENFKRMYPDHVGKITLHVRWGDYVNYPNMHPVMPEEYYRRAINNVIKDEGKDDLLIYVICDGFDRIAIEGQLIKNLRVSFPKTTFVMVKGMDIFNEILMQSLARKQIIANSSFSLLGAVLNETKDLKVYYPCKWFGNGMGVTLYEDLFKPEWNKIDF